MWKAPNLTYSRIKVIERTASQSQNTLDYILLPIVLMLHVPAEIKAKITHKLKYIEKTCNRQIVKYNRDLNFYIPVISMLN
jgi:hypothetical protein